MPRDRRAEVRKLYEQVARIHLNSGIYGWNVDNERSFDRQIYADVLNSVNQPSDKRFEADSPWAAAIFLMDRQARSGFVQRDNELEFAEEIEDPSYKTIFRGQKAAYDDNIEPFEWRHERLPADKQRIPHARLHNWQGAFCLLIKQIVEHDRQFSVQNSMNFAAAQHYGIPTDLLDWTIDSCVSIWFTHDRMKNSGDERGVVFFTDMENQDKSEVIVPPPYVERLYRQRGIFNFTTNRASNGALYSDCSRVYFPLDKQFALPQSFPIPPKLMLAPDPWLDEIVNKAREIAMREDLADDYFDFLRDLTMDSTEVGARREAAVQLLMPDIDLLVGRHAFSERRWNKMKALWIKHVESYIGWFATFDTPLHQHLTAKQTILHMIERNRDGLFVYANSLLRAGARERLGQRGIFVAALREALLHRFPELEAVEAHYVYPVEIANGGIEIRLPS